MMVAILLNNQLERKVVLRNDNDDKGRSISCLTYQKFLIELKEE